MVVVETIFFFIVIFTGFVTIMIGLPILLGRFTDMIFEKIRRRKNHV